MEWGMTYSWCVGSTDCHSSAGMWRWHDDDAIINGINNARKLSITFWGGTWVYNRMVLSRSDPTHCHCETAVRQTTRFPQLQSVQPKTTVRPYPAYSCEWRPKQTANKPMERSKGPLTCTPATKVFDIPCERESSLIAPWGEMWATGLMVCVLDSSEDDRYSTWWRGFFGLSRTT